MKSIYTLLILLTLFCNRLHVAAQDKKYPKNFPGVFAGTEYNTSSGPGGLEIERLIAEKGHWLFGASLGHAFNFSLGTLSLSGPPGGSAYFTCVKGTAHRFFSQHFKGSFFTTGVGLGLRTYEYYRYKSQSVFIAFHAGLGWQFKLGDRMALRWIIDGSFAGEGGITGTRLSLGF